MFQKALGFGTGKLEPHGERVYEGEDLCFLEGSWEESFSGETRGSGCPPIPDRAGAGDPAACPPRLPASGLRFGSLSPSGYLQGVSLMAEVPLEMVQAGGGRKAWRLSRGRTGPTGLSAHGQVQTQVPAIKVQRRAWGGSFLTVVVSAPWPRPLAHRPGPPTSHGPGRPGSARRGTRPVSLRGWAPGPHVWPRLCSGLSVRPRAWAGGWAAGPALPSHLQVALYQRDIICRGVVPHSLAVTLTDGTRGQLNEV